MVWYIVMAGIMLLGVASGFVVTGHVIREALRTGMVGANDKKYAFRGRPIIASLIIASWIALAGVALLGFVATLSKLWEVL